MEIILRRLEEKDAEGMYEWMTDPDIICFFRFDAHHVTLQTCRDFILHANDDLNTLHFAIADENDDYLGTVSLKNVTEKDAEFAISTRKKVHGTGVSYKATMEILGIAFGRMHLEEVYLNVLEDNIRALSFYKKCGFTASDHEEEYIIIRGIRKKLKWYHCSYEHFAELQMKNT